MTLPYIICTTVLIEKSPQALPLGAACITSALKNNKLTKDKCTPILTSVTTEDSDYKTAVQENRIDSFLADKILSGKEPVAVCFSVYVWNRKVLEIAAKEIKRRFSKIVCIAGGPEITADPLSSKVFDYTIAGEGESVIPQIIEAVLDGKAPSNIQGVYNPSIDKPSFDGTVLHALSCDPATLESPWLDGTIDPSNYKGALWELARGCPFKCSYCYESKGEKRVRYFSKERLEKELDFFAEKKVPQVFILDPTYNADKKRAIEMLKLIKQKTPKMFCYFEVRAEFIDRELAQAFTKISCALQIGLQSMHENVLAKVNRTLNKKLFIRNVGFLNEAGTVFGFDLIYGLPGDSLSGFKESIDFALSLYPNNLELFCLSVLPGTDLFTKAKDLFLTWQETPPYNVIHTDKFSEEDISKAKKLSQACSFFYNQGRAVPWFNTIIRPLHIKPSVFFSDFASFCGEKLSKYAEDCLDHKKIEEIQIQFMQKKYKEKKLDYMLSTVEDLIRLNGALSRTLVSGKEELVKLHYNSDDLMSEYATDILFFVKNAKKHPCTVRTFMTANGPDWQNA